MEFLKNIFWIIRTILYMLLLPFILLRDLFRPNQDPINAGFYCYLNGKYTLRKQELTQLEFTYKNKQLSEEEIEVYFELYKQVYADAMKFLGKINYNSFKTKAEIRLSENDFVFFLRNKYKWIDKRNIARICDYYLFVNR